MLYKQITLQFEGGWVLEQRTADKLPVNAFIDCCIEVFGDDVCVENTSFTECTLVIKKPELSRDEITQRINDILKNKLKMEAAAEKANVTIEEIDAAAVESEEGEKPKEGSGEKPQDSAKGEAQDDAPHSRKETLSVGEMLRSLGKDDSTVETDGASTEEKIESLVGAQEFKALTREVKAMAPRIVKHKTFKAFAFQSYLFSINDGCGLSTYLKLFADLLEENELFKFAGSKKTVEEKLLPLTNDRQDPFETVMSHLQGFGKSAGRLICIDISEWMNNLTHKQFRDFLLCLENHSAENIYVFRIPFVESDVLDDINASLQDVLFIRPVSFPPMNTEELTECAKRFLAKTGFSALDEAWEVFQARIVEEKSDGRFYGMNTVNKIIHEMVYRKQLSDALNDKDDFEIKRDDIASLSKTYNSDAVNGMSELKSLVGMDAIISRIEEIVNHIELARKNKNLGNPSMHMRFVGGPGTGKTTVARIIGRMLRERGVLRNGNFFEYSGRDFCGRYVGETAPKTAAMCRDAYGSVLFIDEAYSLYRSDDNERDYGIEALDTLIAEMENHRGDLVVIMAGYTDEMTQLMKGNKGLESRMPYILEFPNYTREQLCEIFFKMLGEGFEYDDDFRDAVTEYFNTIDDDALEAKDFSNARFVRNLFERTCAKAGMRQRFDKVGKLVLSKEDFRLASSESAFRALIDKKSKAKLGF